MMNGADPASYEEAISQLQMIAQELEEDVSVLQRAGEDCVDNCPGDPAAESSKDKVDACAQQINDAVEKVRNVIRDLYDELDRIQEAAAKGL